MTPGFRLDDYVMDVLMRDLVGHDHSPSSFLVYLHLWKHSRGARRGKVRKSHAAIALDIGLSKSAVQQALRNLHRRSLVTSTLRHRTDTPEHEVLRPWASR